MRQTPESDVRSAVNSSGVSIRFSARRIGGWTTVVVVLAFGLQARPAAAGGVLGCTYDQGRPGDLAQVRIWAETSPTAGGWSFGLCHDSSVIEVDSIEDGATTATVNNGTPPEFANLTVEDSGWAVGVVINFLVAASLQPGRDHELHLANYLLIGAEGDATALEFCSTIGSPPVSTVFVYGGASLVPHELRPGLIEIEESPSTFHAPHVSKTYSEVGVVDFGVTLSASANGEFDEVTQGFAMSIAYDTGTLTATSIDPAGPVAAIPGGPDFFGVTQYPEGIAGGVVYSLIGSTQFPLGFEGVDLVHIEFETTMADELGGYFELRWVDGIGPPPPTTNIVVGSGTSWIPILRHGTVRLKYTAPLPFIRGDCSPSGEVDIADVLTLLDYLFGSESGGVPCLEACDVDGDGTLHIGDPIDLLEYLFQSGTAPPAPFPTCGAAPLALSCESTWCP